ncbi:MAG: glycosyltransferase family 4 protein [Armatimonadota bacterium]
MAILHVVQFALPEVSSGYTIRTAAILKQQKALGMDPVVLTSPRQPSGSESIQNGVACYRSGPEPRTRLVWLRDSARVRAVARRIEEIAKERGDLKLLHAHSPVLCGMAALRAGRALGLPVVYEVRGLWEEAMPRHWSVRYRMARAMETRVCRRADGVVTISEGLKREFVGRGVREAKVHVVPNGVDAEQFRPMAADAQWRAERQLGDGPLVVYLGALRGYEGVDLAMEAMPRVRERFPRARLIVVGEGQAGPMLEARAREMGDGVALLPPVAHAEVARWYAVADVVVYPRRSTRATQLVTPLKPLEAMAMGKAVVASDVGGLLELIRDGETGRLFPAESVSALAEAIIELLADEALRTRLGERASRWAREERDWRSIVPRYQEVYEAAGMR